MYKLIRCLIIFHFFLVFCAPAFACDLCAVYNFVESEGGSKGTLNTGIAHQYTHYESNVRPEGFEDFPGQHLESNVTQLVAAYNVSDDFGLQLNLPLIYRDYRRIIEGAVEDGSEKGVGDLSLQFKYSPYRFHKSSSSLFWELRGGLKFPTGDADRLQEEKEGFEESLLRHSSVEGNLVGGDDLALGSGSYDFLFGTGIFYQRERFYINGNVQYTLRQEGDFDYEYGDDLQWDLGPAYYLILEDEQSFALRLRLSGQSKSDDQINGQDIDGTNEDRIFLGPELIYSSGSRWNFRLGVDLPLRDGDSSEEVVPRARVLASFSYKLHMT